MAVCNKKTGFIVFVVMCFLAHVHQAHLPSATISDLTFKNMDFAMNLYRRISTYHDKNIIFSPLSISTSFASLLLGSDGVTHEEILNALNLHQLEHADQPELLPKLFQLLNENVTLNGSLKLDQSMVLFMHTHFEAEKVFEDEVKQFFEADIKRVDFGDTKGAIGHINDYIKLKTHDKITNMISTLDPETRLMLINTIFFQGAWKIPFNPNYTENGPFFIDNYSVVQVPMMSIEDKFYTMDDNSMRVKVLKLPYQGGVSMLIVLPNKHTDYTVIDEKINAQSFHHWAKSLWKTKIEVNLPRFKMEQSYSLHNILPDMGMRSVFDNSANLTKLSKNESLRVSEVLHKAVIEVDETGTTAAAATTIGITPYSLPKRFIVNRPFFFFIYHEATECMLFMGRVTDPTKN